VKDQRAVKDTQGTSSTAFGHEQRSTNEHEGAIEVEENETNCTKNELERTSNTRTMTSQHVAQRSKAAQRTKSAKLLQSECSVGFARYFRPDCNARTNDLFRRRSNETN